MVKKVLPESICIICEQQPCICPGKPRKRPTKKEVKDRVASEAKP